MNNGNGGAKYIHITKGHHIHVHTRVYTHTLAFIYVYIYTYPQTKHLLVTDRYQTMTVLPLIVDETQVV